MNLKSKKVLVTGAGGFIGSHLVEELLPVAGSVKALTVNHEISYHGWLDSLPKKTRSAIELVSGDVRDSFGMIALMKDVDIVFHLAALISIPYSYNYPHLFYETNVVGTLNVLQAARQTDVEKIVHTSTSEVYGTAQVVPITESHPLNPQSPYAASKASADHAVLSFNKTFDLPVAIVRPFNAFGPRQSSRAVIPSIMTQLLAGETKLRLGATHTTRDFTFVKDTAKGFVAAACSEKVIGEIVHLANNFEISIGSVVDTIAQVLNIDIEVVEDKERLRPEKSEVERLWGCNEKAQSLLEWQPEYSGLSGFKSAIKQSVEWYSMHRELTCFSADKYIF